MDHTFRERGFTLVELMIAVVIVGILATMAVVGYRKMVAESHSTEAITTLNAIRVAQEAYHAETGQYLNVSGQQCNSGSCTSLYPQAFFSSGRPVNAGSASFVVGNYKVGWGGSCAVGTECGNWLQLPVHNPGAVMYGYSTTAGLAGTNFTPFTINGSALAFPTPSTSDWYEVSAVGDVDENGKESVYFGQSLNGDIISQNDGE
jgi:type IV pilus assembly protein PilA